MENMENMEGEKSELHELHELHGEAPAYLITASPAFSSSTHGQRGGRSGGGPLRPETPS